MQRSCIQHIFVFHMALKINWDAIGITTSLACAIHCAILPLLLTSLPLFGTNIIGNRSFEYLMIFLAFLIGCYALIHGYRKHHQNLSPVVIFLAGILLLFAKQTWHHFQIWLLIPAIITIVSAHYLNYRLCRKVKPCHSDNCQH